MRPRHRFNTVVFAFFLASSVSAQEPRRDIEVISYGRTLPNILVSAGDRKVTAAIGVMPPGLVFDAGSAQSLSFGREEIVEGKPRTIPLASVPIPKDVKSPLILLFPPKPSNDPAKPPVMETKLIEQDLPDKPRSLNIYNLTSVPMLVQAGLQTQLTTIPAWGKAAYTPPVDRKNRAHVRIGYVSPADNSTVMVKDSASAFPETSSTRMRIVLAAEGMGNLVDKLSAERSRPVVYIDEKITRFQPPGPAVVAPTSETKSRYEKVEIVIPEGVKE
jgi:hypothetical protein